MGDKCAITHQVTIKADLTYEIESFNHAIDHAFLQLPHILTDEQSVNSTLSAVSHLEICQGNSEAEFLELGRKRNGELIDKSGKNNYHSCMFISISIATIYSHSPDTHFFML